MLTDVLTLHTANVLEVLGITSLNIAYPHVVT